MSDATARAGHPAPCDWIDEAPREELEPLFVWVKPDAPMLPPNPRRGREHPSVLLLEGPREAYADEDIRLAARLARHLTAASDLQSSRTHGAYAMIRKEGGQWHASRLSWQAPAMARYEIRDAARILLTGIEQDLDILAPALEAFDAEAGHAPAGPAP